MENKHDLTGKQWVTQVAGLVLLNCILLYLNGPGIAAAILGESIGYTAGCLILSALLYLPLQRTFDLAIGIRAFSIYSAGVMIMLVAIKGLF